MTATDPGLNPGQQALLDAVRTAVMTEMGWEDDRDTPPSDVPAGVIWDTATDVAEAAITAVVAHLKTAHMEHRRRHANEHLTAALHTIADWLNNGGKHWPLPAAEPEYHWTDQGATHAEAVADNEARPELAAMRYAVRNEDRPPYWWTQGRRWPS